MAHSYSSTSHNAYRFTTSFSRLLWAYLLKRIALKEEEEENMNDVKVSIKKE